VSCSRSSPSFSYHSVPPFPGSVGLLYRSPTGCLHAPLSVGPFKVQPGHAPRVSLSAGIGVEWTMSVSVGISRRKSWVRWNNGRYAPPGINRATERPNSVSVSFLTWAYCTASHCSVWTGNWTKSMSASLTNQRRMQAEVFHRQPFWLFSLSLLTVQWNHRKCVQYRLYNLDDNTCGVECNISPDSVTLHLAGFDSKLVKPSEKAKLGNMV